MDTNSGRYMQEIRSSARPLPPKRYVGILNNVVAPT